MVHKAVLLIVVIVATVGVGVRMGAVLTFLLPHQQGGVLWNGCYTIEDDGGDHGEGGGHGGIHSNGTTRRWRGAEGRVVGDGVAVVDKHGKSGRRGKWGEVVK